MKANPKRKTDQEDSLRDKQEEALDEALKNTFPASDPVSIEQPAGRDLLGSEPVIESRDHSHNGLEDGQ